MTADKLLTVSPHYAKEIASNVAKGVELDNVIRWDPVLAACKSSLSVWQKGSK